MQSPSVEINAVIKLISSSATPDIQKAAIYKYFTADVGYRHPLCAVEPAPKSREEVLGVYQWVSGIWSDTMSLTYMANRWCRTLSPDLQVDARDVGK